MLHHLLRVLLALFVVLLNACWCGFGEEPASWTLDDFEDGNLVAATGWSWIVIADDLAGGASQAALSAGGPGAGASQRALRLSGRLENTRGWPFAGAWLPMDRAGGTVTLSPYEGVRLRVKGPARLQIGFRAGNTNFMADVEAGSDWQMVEIPFSRLAPLGKVPEGTRWNGDAVSAFGVTTPQLRGGESTLDGRADFAIDDVALYGGAGPGRPPAASGTPGGLAVVPFAPAGSIPRSGWVHLADDPARDGNMPALPDAIHLEAIPESGDGLLWVRVTLREPPHDWWMGINLVLDLDGDPDNGQSWWGANAAFKYDQIVTAWCWRVEAGCQGFIGVATADQIAAGTYTAGDPRSVRLAIDHDRKAFVVGVPRSALRLGKAPIRLVAAVGSALLFADDVPGQGAALLH